MDIKIACPHCDQHLLVDSTAVGQQVNCPTCSTPFQIADNLPGDSSRRPVPRHNRPFILLVAASCILAAVVVVGALYLFRSGNPPTGQAPAANKQGTTAENQQPKGTSKEAWRHDMAAFAKEVLAVAAKSKVPDYTMLTTSMRNSVTFNNGSGVNIGVVLRRFA
jgi:hypothetical protein